MIKVSFDHIKDDLKVNFDKYQEKVSEINKTILNRTGAGADYLGWLEYPNNYDKNEIKRIIKKANDYREKYDTLVVCGIGGSYLGARAVIDALNGLYSEDKMQIVFLGNTLDPNYVGQTMKYLEKRNFAVCVISKSGTTTETAIGFRLLKRLLESKYSKKEVAERIVVVTDKEKGALKTLQLHENYEAYVLPGNIGGRFSVLTPVGLFPIACAGIDINEFLDGFKEGTKLFTNPNLKENIAYQYACQRNKLYKHGYPSEMLISYELKNKMLIEWWKQLFDESEGKSNLALLATSAIFTTDLHSMGQFIQEGSKVLFETVLYVEQPKYDVIIEKEENDLDQLNYLEGKTLSYVNKKAYEGTLEAHATTGEVPNITITLDKLDAKNLGLLLDFFMNACAMSAYMLGINPFNQPGVEIYKKNMFSLLGKKGY